MTERVDICICTYRRDSVVETIESVARQSLPPGVAIRIIVADNDVAPSGRERVLACGEKLGIELRYLHAPANNISIARNACIAASDTAWLAFIDDDEVAAPEWLAQLWTTREKADFIFGPARARYGREAPRWMVRGDFHSSMTPAEMHDMSVSRAAGCGNVLMRRAALDRYGLRFDPDLGRTGGEDTMFFYEIRLRGARLGFAADAAVYEEVPPQRQSLGWILRRRYRAGQTYAHLIRRFHPRDVGKTAALSVAKILYCGVLALVTALFPTSAARFLARASMHVGVVSFTLHGKTYAEYSQPASGLTPS